LLYAFGHGGIVQEGVVSGAVAYIGVVKIFVRWVRPGKADFSGPRSGTEAPYLAQYTGCVIRFYFPWKSVE
jgi:hypothetical protein